MKLHVVKIKGGTNDGQFLVKYHKGYDTSKDIGLHNLYHSKIVAEKEAELYVKECERSDKEKDSKSLRGRLYEVITFNLVTETPLTEIYSY